MAYDPREPGTTYVPEPGDPGGPPVDAPPANTLVANAAAASGAATGQSFTGEDDIMVGLDGKIFQRIRDGFRTVGWKELGTTADLTAAAVAGGFNFELFTEEVQRQVNTNNSQSWQAGASGYNGLTNLQLQQLNQTQGGMVSAGGNAWSLGQSGYGGLTNQQLQQQNNTNTGILSANKNTWDMGASQWDPNQTRQQYGLTLGEYKDKYSMGETQYGLLNQEQQHQLEDQQRALGLQQTAFNLGREGQRQKTETYKLNQTDYEQMKGAQSRDLSGYGYGAMQQPQRLVGS